MRNKRPKDEKRKQLGGEKKRPRGNDGWLARFGFHDFAGSGPVHLVGGASALVAAWYIGSIIFALFTFL